jgi:mono/diheme cytochrome c family protein
LTTAKAARGALLAAGAVVTLTGCTDWAGHDIDMAVGQVPALSTMRRDIIPDNYEMLRMPAEGTVPVVHPLGDVPGPYTQLQIDSIAPLLSNPLPATATVLERGRLQYEQNCAVCHGVQGDGRGSVIDPRKFPFASPLGAGSPATGRSDGYLYAVIDVGRGLMPPYGHRMTHADRWAVVHYMRQLQGTPGPPPVPGPQVTPATDLADPDTEPTAPGPQPVVIDTAPATTQN